MARRTRFVKPGLVRLQLADVYQRAHQQLLDRVKDTKGRKAIDALQAEIAQAADRLREAEADAEWIEVKNELTAGEQRAVYGRLVKELHFGERASLNPEQVGLSKVIAYLVNWSLSDDGKVVPVSEDSVNALDGATYGEIVNAIDHHEEQVELARAARKNDQDGKVTSEATSPSVDA